MVTTDDISGFAARLNMLSAVASQGARCLLLTCRQHVSPLTKPSSASTPRAFCCYALLGVQTVVRGQSLLFRTKTTNGNICRQPTTSSAKGSTRGFATRANNASKGSGRRSYAKKKSAEFTPDTISYAEVFVERRLAELWRPALFAVGFCGSCYVGAVIWRYERERKRLEKLFNFHYTRKKAGDIRKDLNETWNSLSVGHKTVASIVAANVIVTIAWRSRRLQKHMLAWFTNSFYRKHNSITMVTSTFSHHSLIHLGLNMFVLCNFAPIVAEKMMGVEQFCGFYLAAGTLASLAGISHKALMANRIGALGASGAILGVLCYTCIQMPDARLSIIFLPFFTFSALTGVIGIVALDSVGLLLGWRLFDHAAHLGGSLFGIWYAKYGEAWLWKGPPRKNIERSWKRIRGDK